MQSFNKLVSTFDKFLLAGLGCGVVLLCGLGGWVYYIMSTLPVPRSDAAQTANADFPTMTSSVSVFELPTATLILMPFLTSDGSLSPTQIPSPAPLIFDGTPPSGKIVYVCYVKQIDQICIVNADGNGREQLTDFQATAFYPSLPRMGTQFIFRPAKMEITKFIPSPSTVMTCNA